jgi:hypothetical protein
MLMTDDIHRARPLLAHSSNNSVSMPWKLLEKPPLPEVPRNRCKTHYPPVNPDRRPRDLSLTTSDIEGCQPQRTGVNGEGRPRNDKPVEPMHPSYSMPSSSLNSPPYSVRASGRCTLDVSDIEGTSTTPRIPHRMNYGDVMRVEDEFKSRRHATALADVAARALGTSTTAMKEMSTPRAALTPRLEGPQRGQRCTNPLEPRYRVPLARDQYGTSICCTWAEEKSFMPAALEDTRPGEIGYIPGSQPTAQMRGNGQAGSSLESRDIAGAASMRRVGAQPYNLWGPFGNRPEHSSNLNTSDIEGAQADTVCHYPKVAKKNASTRM